MLSSTCVFTCLYLRVNCPTAFRSQADMPDKYMSKYLLNRNVPKPPNAPKLSLLPVVFRLVTHITTKHVRANYHGE